MESAVRATRLPMSGDGPVRPLPYGVGVAAVLAACLLGALAATLLARQALSMAALPGAALIVCSVLALRVGWKTAGRYSALGLVGLTCFSWCYLLVLALESAGRAMRAHLVPFQLGILLMLGMVALFLVAPVAIPAFLVRRARRRGVSDLPDMTPHMLGTCIGAAFVIFGFVLVFGTAVLSPKGAWPAVNSVLMSLALPVLFRPLWILSYGAILTRWQTREPAPLQERLAELRDLARFEFDRVMCLRASFGNGRPCFVILGSRRSTLVISERIVSALTSGQLLAVLAHEAAHVVMNHGNRRLAWTALGGAVYVGVVMATTVVTIGIMPPSFGFMRITIVVMPMLFLRGLYENFVTRRHEAEADKFAAMLVGATAMIGALEALRGPNAIHAHTHNRWTTHGTWERRSARIRKYGAGAADGEA
jgi:Zn-dependent protease with chaperone function